MFYISLPVRAYVSMPLARRNLSFVLSLSMPFARLSLLPFRCRLSLRSLLYEVMIMLPRTTLHIQFYFHVCCCVGGRLHARRIITQPSWLTFCSRRIRMVKKLVERCCRARSYVAFLFTHLPPDHFWSQYCRRCPCQVASAVGGVEDD